MKTLTEIKKLAKDFAVIDSKDYTYHGFIKGYIQCQEDMDKEIEKAYKKGLKDSYNNIVNINQNIFEI